MLSTGMLKKPWIWSAGRARPAVLPGVAVVRDHRGDTPGRSALERVDHDAELHQVLVRRRTGGLHDEDVASANVLVDLDVGFTVGEAAHLGLAELDAEVGGDLLRQRRVRIPGEQHGVEKHSSLRRGLIVSAPAAPGGAPGITA
jgi:hypothetical protein